MARPSILVVEDEGIVSIDIRNMLERAGFKVAAVAYRGEEAVEKARSALPDLVLMDIGLKGRIDGIEAAGRIRKMLGIPVVFLTGFADEETTARAQNIQPAGFITKPVNEEELKAELEKALGTKDT